MPQLRARSPSNAGIQRELGRLAEAAENSKDDSKNLAASVEKLHDSIDALSSRVTGLDQTMRATAAQVSNISVEKCGERLDRIEALVFTDGFRAYPTRLDRVEAAIDRMMKFFEDDKLPAVVTAVKSMERFFEDERLPMIERTVKDWKRWIGSGVNFVGKAILAILAAGLIGGTGFTVASKVAAHLVP